MKQAIFLSAILFSWLKCSAVCVSAGLSLWPSGQTVKQNSLFIINGHPEREYIHQLNKKYPIYLQSGDEKIKLKIEKILAGEDGVTQALLVPDEKLTAGKEYRLVIDSLPKYAPPFHKWNSSTQKFVPAKWLVEKGSDTEKPLWLDKPTEKEKIVKNYGCGDDRYVNFSFKVSDKSDFLIKATVTSLKTKKTTSFYLEPNGTTLMVGHGMCGGPFSLAQGKDFEVSFDIMDASGNVTPWVGKKIRFTKPISALDDE